MEIVTSITWNHLHDPSQVFCSNRDRLFHFHFWIIWGGPFAHREASDFTLFGVLTRILSAQRAFAHCGWLSLNGTHLR